MKGKFVNPYINTAAGMLLGLAAFGAHAAPTFSLDPGPFSIKFTNFENFENLDDDGNVQPGSTNYGIFNVTSISDLAGNNQWVSGDGGGNLQGIFYDITVDSVDGAGNATASGGRFDLFLNPATNSFDPFAGTGGYLGSGVDVDGNPCVVAQRNCYDGISNVADGIHFLSFDLVSGIDPSDPNVTLDADFDDTTSPQTGDASWYGDVVGGEYADNFDTNGQSTPHGNRDLFGVNDFQPSELGEDVDWQLRSDDPVTGAYVPAPGVLSILGFGLLAIAGMSRAGARRVNG